MTRRGATTLAGLLPVDKPTGMTSHDVVAAVRRLSGEGRVGHAGTLDPTATGLLVVLIGPYSRLAPYLSGEDKSYVATFLFGSETDTDDAAGVVTLERPVPQGLLTESGAAEALRSILGDHEQVPPDYSAVKSGGRTAHRAARGGSPIELSARPVTVHAATLLSVDPDARAWIVEIEVSKGTYVRSLARDLGRAQGTAAHVGDLRRTRSGMLDVAAAHSLDQVESAAAQDRLVSLFADPIAALGLPTVSTADEGVLHGGALARELADAPDGSAVAVLVAGRLAGVYRAEGDHLRPEVVLPLQGAA